jgi:hypothetical protein
MAACAEVQSCFGSSTQSLLNGTSLAAGTRRLEAPDERRSALYLWPPAYPQHGSSLQRIPSSINGSAQPSRALSDWYEERRASAGSWRFFPWTVLLSELALRVGPGHQGPKNKE